MTYDTHKTQPKQQSMPVPGQRQQHSTLTCGERTSNMRHWLKDQVTPQSGGPFTISISDSNKIQARIS